MPIASSLLLQGRTLFGIPAATDLSDGVYAEQIRLLYNNAYTGLLVNLVVATAAVGVMWPHVPGFALWPWVSVLLLLTFTRARLTANWLRLPTPVCNAPTWGKRYLYGSLASGIIWGAMGVLLELYGTHHEHSFTAYILGGMAAGAIATNGALPAAYLSFMLPALLPVNLMLYLQGDNQHLLIGSLTSFFVVVLLVTFGRYHRVVHDSIAFRFEKEQAVLELQAANQQLHDITAELAEGLFVLNSEGRVTFMNPEAERLLGWRLEELGDKKMHDLVHHHASTDLESDKTCSVSKALRERSVFRQEDELFRRKDGTQFPVAYIASPMSLPDGEPAVVVSFHDITVRKAMEKQLARLATHDDLTGLYNRRELERLLDDELVRSARYQRPLSLFILDVDHFKQVNDTYGHDVGDEVLRELGRRIRTAIRTTDIPTRYGGEEFVVIQTETQPNEAMAAAERVRQHVAATTFPLSDGRELEIRVSIGVASTPENGETVASLLKGADTALYRAKKSGRNQVCAA